MGVMRLGRNVTTQSLTIRFFLFSPMGLNCVSSPSPSRSGYNVQRGHSRYLVRVSAVSSASSTTQLSPHLLTASGHWSLAPPPATRRCVPRNLLNLKRRHAVMQ
ncbi:hypothetical protein ACLKA7_015415 [Drosophila subpalustris]